MRRDHRERARTDCPQNVRAPAHERERGEDGEHRERAQQEPVGGAVDDAAPEDRAVERRSGRVSRRVVAERDRGEQRACKRSEEERPAPPVGEHRSEREFVRTRPEEEERGDGDDVDRVVGVAWHGEPIGEDVGDEEANHRRCEEPQQLSDPRIDDQVM